jgi:hypothetical protein
MSKFAHNPRRAEIEAELGGKRYVLCLTLGALAELEAAFGASDLVALAERFGQGRISARDAIKIIAAGLRGGGNEITEEEAAKLGSPSGAAGYVKIVSALLAATFGTLPEEPPSVAKEDIPPNP